MTAPAGPQHGYLVLADISGYTAYLTGTEIDHAHEILTDLLEVILGHFKTLLTIAKLEGDAVFAYAPATQLPHGELLLELIETTYAAFRDRQTSMHRRTTCTCNACRNIPTLDLKFMAHHGDYILHQVGGHTEVMGADVALAHRLMKNHVVEATGWQAYALFSERGLQHLGVRPENMHAQNEEYEHLGVVPTYSVNLHALYRTRLEARRVFIEAANADAVALQDFAAPPPVVWDWMNNPASRNIWGAAHGVWRAGERAGGRRGVGARNHCAHGHGKGEAVETVLDWRPFEYVTVETRDGNLVIGETLQLEALPNGHTRLHDHLTIKLPLPRVMRRAFLSFMMTKVLKYDHLLRECARLLMEQAG